MHSWYGVFLITENDLVFLIVVCLFRLLGVDSTLLGRSDVCAIDKAEPACDDIKY